jgi:hypothetical protein
VGDEIQEQDGLEEVGLGPSDQFFLFSNFLVLFAFQIFLKPPDL